MSIASPSPELSKSYDPAAIEPAVYQAWLDENCFHAEPSDKGESYSIVIPPPNVTGALHLGHALNNTLQDILTRKARMEGKNAVWIPGLDHAGIATQAVVEKQLKEIENKTRHDVGREGLVERIWKWKQQYGDRIIGQLKRMGCSCDWSRQRFTLDDMCAKAVRETFFKLFKDGLVYRGKRLVNWDVFLQTSVSDDEIYHETVKTNLWHIRYPIVSQKASTQDREPGGSAAGSDAHEDRPAAKPPGSRAAFMIVATTRPETMLGDTAVAVHPDDPRWNWAIGMEVELPLTNRRIPIIADPILVNMEFGSGCVKVTPAHDPNDYAVWQRHKGQPDEIDIINILNPDGTLNEHAGPYKGMKIDAARKTVVHDLLAGGFMTEADIQPYETNVGYSDRSKTPIQPYLSDQWFVKMAPLAEPALQVVRDGTIQFFPERHAQQYLAWLGEKRDWPISRQLWWGHRIPVWRFGGVTGVPKEKKFAYGFMQWQIDGRIALSTRQFPSTVADGVFFWPEGDVNFVCVRYPDDLEVIEALDEAGFVQDPDVLDTWFSSALWPHSTLGWPERTADLAKWYPTSVLLTGRDIITLWVARMVMTGLYNMGAQTRSSGVSPVDPSPPSFGFEKKKEGRDDKNGRDARATEIPFHHVAINPTILDGKGERMSKSKGNGVDPVDIIELYGADAMRFTLTTMATETQDVRMPVKKLPDGRNSSEKFDLGRNFCNKLWNASRFAFANIEQATGIPPVSGAQNSSSGVSPVDSSLPSFNSHSNKEGGGKQNGRDARATLLRAEHGRGARDTGLIERWILSRLARTVKDANDALAVYRFDLYAKACYDFFWRDFCDWYVEAIKPDFKDAAKAQASARTLAAVLDATLRLMHPMIPFITETLWGKFNEICPERGIPALKGGAWGGRLIKAPWPEIDATLIDDPVERDFETVREVITTIRNVRNEYKADPKKPVTITIGLPDTDANTIIFNQTTIELLAGCTIKDARAGLTPVPNSIRATGGGCEIYLEGLVDADAEKLRQTKSRDELMKKINAMTGRLSNESYLAKAPEKLVEETRQQLANAQAELAKLSAQVQG